MRLLSVGLFGLALALAPYHGAAAQGWPDRPVTFIVPFPAGSAIDSLSRAVANAASESLGKQFIVENRAGAGGNIGGAAAAKAPADGYTFLFGTPAPIAMNKLMYKGLPYDSDKDFTPVVLVAKSPLIITTKLDFPAKTFGELVAYAKQNPGKVNVGHPGNGTLGHITSELTQQFAGMKLTNVPYRGTSPLMTDLLGGQIDVAMDFMPTYVPLVLDKKIRAPRRDDVRTRRAIAQCADRAGGGIQGLRGVRMVRDCRSDRHPEGDRRQGERHRERLPEERQGQDLPRAKRLAGRRRFSRGLQGIYRRRACQVEAGDRGRQDRNVAEARPAARLRQQQPRHSAGVMGGERWKN